MARIPTVADEDEAQGLRALSETPPAEVLVVSDLHLGCGRDRTTGRFVRTENFFADEPFAALLGFYGEAARRGALLVLNGDVFDFLRITEIPRGDEVQAWSDALACLGVDMSQEQLAASISPKERRFGLRTNDFKSVWKLRCIIEGHDTFFTALAGWATAGGILLFVKGNHDLEIHWPLIRKAIRAELLRRGVPARSAGTGILFCETSIRIANIYIEHGHRFERATRVDGPATLPQNPEQLNLPLGSFVNRYLINPIERLEPFVDNVKPIEELLRTMVQRHPLLAFGILWRSWRLLLRAAESRHWRQGLAYALFFGSLAVPVLTLLVIALILALPIAGARIFAFFGRASWAFAALGLLFPFAAGALRDAFPRRHPAVGEDGFACGIHGALKDYAAEPVIGTRYGMVGHTHVQDVQRLPPIGGAPALYLNTGAWIPLWQADRPDLIGRTLHPFVRFTMGAPGAYRHEYSEWDWVAGRPESSTILEPMAEHARPRRGRR